eukprot:TRINITY_DN11025_c0_g1_i1.p1 TRINITY_DN11025_c0_g1~~TRINITY_DN11025_c0_g1_i1.p1  ORF type:complete len:370 (+),score=115.96 TRINITY_DN11025_c0_g1_i1:95-1204(+)
MKRGIDAPASAPPKKLVKMGIDAQKTNHNADICTILLEMGQVEKSQGQLHKWKAYRQAVDSLRALDKRITSGAEARSLPGVGAKIAAKIDEILKQGSLHQLEAYNSNPRVSALRLFTKISGIGPKAAQTLVDKGYTTLQDLHDKGELQGFTHHQKLGVQYYDDFLQKIPYAEVALLAEAAGRIARSRVDTSLILTPCGSHRRKVGMSGDIDCLLTHPLTGSDSGDEYVYLKLVAEALREGGFLVDTISEGSTKLMGVCRLPGSTSGHPARRIDIRWVPRDSYPTALLYFTGSSIFNTSMRTQALGKGFSLNEYGLYRVPKAPATAAGVPIGGSPSKPMKDPKNRVPVSSEEDIFSALGIEYCRPEERNL